MKTHLHLLCLLSLFFLSSIAVSAQVTFQKRIGGIHEDAAYSSIQTLDGCYVIAGYTKSYGAGARDAYVVKTDSLGNVLWAKTYGGPADDEAVTIKQTSDSGFIIVGKTKSFGAGNDDLYLVRTDASGNMLWSKTYGSPYADEGADVLQINGGFLVLGGYNDEGMDVLLMKINDNGDTIKVKKYDSFIWYVPGGWGYWDHGKEIKQAPDGNYIIIGYTYNNSSPHNFPMYLKVDTNLNLIWFVNTNLVGANNATNSCVPTSDGGYIICGGGDTYPFLMKINSAGAFQWGKTYKSPSATGAAKTIAATADGGYIMSVYSYGNSKYRLIKTDANGDTLWTRRYGGFPPTWGGNSLTLTNDGGYLFSGQNTLSVPDSVDMLLIKTDSLGYTSSCYQYPDTILVGTLVASTTYRTPNIYDSCFINIPSFVENSQVAVSADYCACRSYNSSITAGSDTIFCFGDSVTLHASSGNYIYAWNTGQTTQSITVDSSGTFSLEVIDSLGCASNVSQMNVQVNPLPIVSFSGLPDTVCINYGTFVLSANPAGGIFSGPGMTDSIFDPNSAGLGSHQIIYSYSDSNTCSAVDTQNVFVDICAGINEEDNLVSNSYLVISPNPFHSIASVQLPEGFTQAELKMYNVLGEEIYNSVISNRKTVISNQGFAPGVYFYRVFSQNRKNWSGKVVIE